MKKNILNNKKGTKHGFSHVRSNSDFNNHNTARDEKLSLKRKAPSSYELVRNKKSHNGLE